MRDVDHANKVTICLLCSYASLLSCSRSGQLRLHGVRQENSGAQLNLEQHCSWQAAANVEGMVRMHACSGRGFIPAS